MQIKLGSKSLALGHPQVMGVLNITPDSFSDGGRFVRLDDALQQAERMVSDGAAIVDIGGESTRPGAGDVSEQCELDRVIPVVEALAGRIDIAISVDTSKPKVMGEVISAGATMINDVFALRAEGAIAELADRDCAICLMHMQGLPRNMQKAPAYNDVVADVSAFLKERIAACTSAGIAPDRVVLDPGFGFGKTDSHNLDLLANLDLLQILGRPILVGLSRKRTLGNITGRDIDARMPAGLAAALLAVQRGASIVRTHDVAPTTDALKIAAAVAAQSPKNNEPGKEE